MKYNDPIYIKLEKLDIMIRKKIRRSSVIFHSPRNRILLAFFKLVSSDKYRQRNLCFLILFFKINFRSATTNAQHLLQIPMPMSIFYTLRSFNGKQRQHLVIVLQVDQPGQHRPGSLRAQGVRNRGNCVCCVHCVLCTIYRVRCELYTLYCESNIYTMNFIQYDIPRKPHEWQCKVQV